MEALELLLLLSEQRNFPCSSASASKGHFWAQFGQRSAHLAPRDV